MDEHPKTKIQIDQSEISHLQKILKTGMIIPVFIESKISENYYLIRIKSVRLHAFSEINLLNNSVFVRVKELKPIPKLQLIFCDASFSANNINIEEIENLNPQDLQLLFSLNPMFKHQGKKSYDLNQLIRFAKLKTLYSLIPVHLSLQSGIDISQHLTFYHHHFIDYPLESIVRLPQDYPLLTDVHLIEQISSHMKLLESLNAENSSQNSEFYHYEYWLIPYKNKAYLCPIEALYINQKMKRFNTAYTSKHLGDISIHANHKTYWSININSENSIFQKELMKISSSINKDITNIVTHRFDLNFGITPPMNPEQSQYQLMDITING